MKVRAGCLRSSSGLLNNYSESMAPNPALYTDAPGRHGLCIFHRKGRAGPRRAGKRER